MPSVAEKAEIGLRMVREAPLIAYDTESSGVDWKRNFPIGYVITTQDTSVYVPVRHGGGGNLPDAKVVPPDSPEEVMTIHAYESELARAFDERNRLGYKTVGHYIKFDCHMSANADIMLGRNTTCTQNREALLDEFAKSYSLEASAERRSVAAKKSANMYEHIANIFGCPATRNSMAHYWKLAGDDPVAVNYAEGDGTSTIQLYLAQQTLIEEQGLQQVNDLEDGLIWTLFRMERRGIKVDVDYLMQTRDKIRTDVEEIKATFPEGFNPRSPVKMREYVTAAGRTDWPTTDKGNPSFTETWLKTFPEGQRVVNLRKWTNLSNTFITPLIERHVWNGRVHATLNQLKTEDFGTPARLSCSEPNLQQIPKRDKAIATLFRRGFVVDEGHKFYEGDWSQCLVAGTKVAIPATNVEPTGWKNIEDIRPGDWVYSFDDNLRLTCKPVTWAGKTGKRKIVQVEWMTNGRSYGDIKCTPDHRIRMLDGSYRTITDLMAEKSSHKSQHPYHHRVMAMNRRTKTPNGGTRWYLQATGHKSLMESRVVFEAVNGWAPEVVHHIDHNRLNNDPNNLKATTIKSHASHHRKSSVDPHEIVRLLDQGMSQQKVAEHVGCSRSVVVHYRNKFMNNHIIYDIVDVEGEHDVYDITVADTHNFIANEICVHNCEPRLFGHYSQEPALIEGYSQEPFRDVHQVVADMLSVERDPTAKRMNMGIFTGMFPDAFAGHMGWDVAKATRYWNEWFNVFPKIKDFQLTAKNVLKARGFVRTLLGRRGRLDHPRFAYRAVSKIIQGGNADIMKWMLWNIDLMLEAEDDLVQLLMSIHDSFEWQAPDTPEGRRISAEIVRMMEDVQSPPFNLRVPFVVDVGSGDNWCEATFGAEAA